MLLSQIPQYYRARRDQLVRDYPGAVFIIPSHPDLIRNSDVHHPYRQDSQLYYLTGFEEPESCLVLAPSLSRPGQYRSIMFVMPRDPEKEMWEGERHGLEGVQKIFGADEAYSIQDFDEKLPELLRGSSRLFYRLGRQNLDRRVMEALEFHRQSEGRSGKAILAIEDPSEPIGEMRLFKSQEEIALMQKACSITAFAHKKVMMEVRPGMNEGEIEALVDYEFRRSGCHRVGYGSIVAGGKNAACLHYRSNNAPLRDGDLLLIDAGGEYGFYSADITRTFPVGRGFSKAQAQVYDLVLQVQKNAIARVKPGAKLPEIHQNVCVDLVDGLLSLGLLRGKANEILKTKEYRRFYPHNTSHWLGLDVHDAGLYLKNGEPRVLESGMVLTIEPGFYVQPADHQTPSEYRDLGIRIEDDIWVTPQGCEVLTREAPKERAEIEALRKY